MLQYSQGLECKSTSTFGINIKGERTLNKPGDWLVVMKPGFTSPCVKCCNKHIQGSKPAHDVCEGFDLCKYEGVNYYYGWLSSEKAKTHSQLIWSNPIGLTDSDSCVMQTLMSCGSNDGYIAWNDQSYLRPGYQWNAANKGGSVYDCWEPKETFVMPKHLGACVSGKCANVDAHDKGFAIFNDKIGILCTHSCPGWPMTTGGNPPSCFTPAYMANQYQSVIGGSGGLATGPGQSFAFTVMSREKFDDVMPKLFKTEQCNFQDSYIPNCLQSHYPNVLKLMQSVFMQVPMMLLPGHGPSHRLSPGMVGVGCVDHKTCEVGFKGPFNQSDADRCNAVTSSDACSNPCSYSQNDFTQEWGCTANAVSCHGMSNSLTVWKNLTDIPTELVLTIDISPNVKILAKSGYFKNGNADIWADVIAPVVGSSLVGTTWDMQFGTLEERKGKNGYNAADFSYFNINTPECKDKCQNLKDMEKEDSDCDICIRKKVPVGGCATEDAPFTSDHSKMAIATSNNWCAIGGLNRMNNYEHSPAFDQPKGACSQCCRGTLFTLI